MPATTPKPIKIVQATWGVLDNAAAIADVTPQITALLPNPPLSLNIPQVNPQALGGLDPAPGQPKALKVRYTMGTATGAIMEKKAAEGAPLTINVIPPPAPAVAAAAPAVPAKPRVGGTPAPYLPSRNHAVQPIKWESKEGKLFANGQQFRLKGVNYFGCETNTRYPHGLWKLKLSQVLDFFTSNDFNAIRLPFSLAMALDLGKVNDQWLEDADLRNLPCGQLFSKIIDKFAERGVLVMLDMHRLNEEAQSEMWYDGAYTECDLLEGWDKILDITKDKWNVFALDIKNEPYGECCWGKKGEAKDWKLAAEKICNHISKNHPTFKGLFFIEGINKTENMACDNPCPHAAWWGGSFQGLQKAPMFLAEAESNTRIVFSPHVYGPSVYMQDYFKVKDFPKNMPAIWEAHWGFAQKQTGCAVVIGEWGGWYKTEEDQIWQQALADYLIENGFQDQFYSGDTGGLVDEDWVTPIEPKLELLAKVQPNPTKVFVDKNGVVSLT